MTIDDVLDLLKERVDFYDDCGDTSAAEGNADEAEVMYAGARQWQDALDAVKELHTQRETCLDNCETCEYRLREAQERLAVQ